MSLTSYRAAPPRVVRMFPRKGMRERVAGLAATYSSAAGAAVPSAQRVFTAEFGMGSGVWPRAMATRPARLRGAAGGVARVTGLGDRARVLAASAGCHVRGRRRLAYRSCVSAPACAGALPSAEAEDRVLPLCAAAVSGMPALAGGSPGIKRTIERLVPVSCAGCPASTSGLSTWWSSTALGETWF
jgi:hypothetical protein